MKLWKTMMVLVASAGWAMNAFADKLLSSHETVAVFDGVRTQTCKGLTGRCPWECGDSGEYAGFSIKKYLKYEKAGEYGMAEQTQFSFQINAYKGKDNKQPACSPKLLKTVNGLKPGDYVLLSWNHNYVNRNGTSMPEYPAVKLEAVSKDAAEKLMAAATTPATPGDAPAPKPATPTAPAAAKTEAAADKWRQYQAVFVGKLERIEHSPEVGRSMPPHRVANLVFTVEEVKHGVGLAVGQSVTIVDAAMRKEPISYPLGKSYLVCTQGKQYGADRYTIREAASSGCTMAPELAVLVGNTSFTKDLYGKLKDAPGNLFLSPYSISTALAMTYGGARGETEKQMAQTLHFTVPQAELHPAFAKLQAALAAVQAKGKVKLAVANSLWPQQDYTFLPDYLELCKVHYGTAVTPVDFKGATEAARKSINGWVEDRTNNKIQELFKPGVLEPLTRLVLVNAIYFKGDWASQFKKEATKPAPFHLADGKDVEAPTMFQTAEFKYGETAEAQLLEMPYAGNDLSMLIVLPRKADGLPALETKFGTINLAAWTQGMRPQKTQVWLPKFKTTSEFSLNQTLAALGMKDAFSQRDADFSGMDGGRNLYISAVVHKAFVEVNEEGTEAAAATGVVMSLRSARIEPPPAVFRADHPFLFLIRDNASGSVLFLGRIADPTK